LPKPKTEHSHHQFSPPGFTLVEMMVVLAILGIVVVGVMGVIISQNKVYYSEEELIDMQLNANVALDRLSREIRMAGFGCKDDIQNGITINGTTYSEVLNHTNIDTASDNTTSLKTDQLTILSALEKVSDIDKDSSGATTYNSSTIFLKNFTDSGGTAYFNNNADDKKYCYISPSIAQVFFTVTGTDAGSSSITIDKTTEVSEYDQIFRLRAYSYLIGISPASNMPGLYRRIENTAANEVAEGIEDLQFQFGWDIDGDGTFNPTSSGDWKNTLASGEAGKVIAIRIIILAITLHPDREFTDIYDDDSATSGRQYVQADHAITYYPATSRNTPYDEHYHRHRLESIVFVRNLNL